MTELTETQRKMLTEEERGWLEEAREEILMDAVGLCYDVPTMLGRLAEARKSAVQAWRLYNREAKTAGELIHAESERDKAQDAIANLQEDVGRAEAELVRADIERQEAQGKLEASESARETLAELHESIASQLTTAGYVTPTPVAVEQVLTMLDEVRKWRDLPPIERLFGELNYILRKDK